MCALCATTASIKSVRCSFKGSGLWGNWPLGVQWISTVFTPKALSNLGTAMPPVEFTASTTTLKFLDLMAGTSTRGRANIAWICLSIYVSLGVIVPKSSTALKSKLSLWAISNIEAPASALRNSPLWLSNFSAFHCLGLWLAVKIIPPWADSIGTATSTVGVVDKPKSTTSIPWPTRVCMTKVWIISPEGRASRPMTNL